MSRGIYKRLIGPRGQKRLEMIGQKFGRLSILSYNKKVSERISYDYYLCRCDCGVEKSIRGAHLRSGATRSCGCLSKEKSKERCKKLGKQKQIGENNPNYLDGFSAEKRKFRKIIHARDKVCQYNDNKHKGRLEAHHLDGDEYNNDPKNGALLCKSHHKIVTNNNVWRLSS